MKVSEEKKRGRKIFRDSVVGSRPRIYDVPSGKNARGSLSLSLSMFRDGA